MSDDAFFQSLLRLGDDSLILGQRLSELCGHAPALEVDLALANLALDLIGQAVARACGRSGGRGPGCRRTCLSTRLLRVPQLPSG